MQNTERPKKKYGIKYLILGLAIFIFFIMVFGLLSGGSDGNNSSPQTQQIPTQEQDETLNEPQLLGKWFGQRNVYLGGGPKYLATFDPPLPDRSLLLPPIYPDPIYPYLVGLINEVWGLSLSDLSKPRLVSPFIVYENLNGDGSFYFLPLKDEATRTVYAVGFEKK